MEEVHELCDGEIFLFFALDIEEDLAAEHHDQAVAAAQGVTHVVRDHEGCEMTAVHDIRRDPEYLFRCLRVEGCGMLIEQQQLRVGHGSHEQGECLALAAGEQAYLGFQPVLESEVQGCDLLAEALALVFGGAPAKRRRLAAPGSDGEVFLDHHARGRAHHRVLENAADELRAAMLGPFGDIRAIDDDAALIDRIGPGDGVHERGFACAVAADDRDEIAGVEMQGNVMQGKLFGNRARIEGLGDMFNRQHYFTAFLAALLKRA